MYVYRLIPSSVSMAHGGPLLADEPNKATPTRPGRFVIGSVGPHVSPTRWLLSSIPWGTPLGLTTEKALEVQLGGNWVGLHTLPGWRERFASYPPGAPILVREAYSRLMNKLSRSKFDNVARKQLPAPWNTDLPQTWVLNDFGQVAVKYFVDANYNRKLDGKEQLLSDFIHTTPNEELELAISRKREPTSPMTLEVSHGCIHLLPNIMQDWVAKGVLAVGATLEVHRYTELTIPPSFERPTGRPGVEIHFYPGMEGIALYRVTKKQLNHPLHLPHG